MIDGSRYFARRGFPSSVSEINAWSTSSLSSRLTLSLSLLHARPHPARRHGVQDQGGPDAGGEITACRDVACPEQGELSRIHRTAKSDHAFLRVLNWPLPYATARLARMLLTAASAWGTKSHHAHDGAGFLPGLQGRDLSRRQDEGYTPDAVREQCAADKLVCGTRCICEMWRDRAPKQQRRCVAL